MRFSKTVLAAALTLGLGAIGISPSWAAADPALTDTSFNAAGLIVKYKSGISPVAVDGQPTGENAVGIDLNLGRDIGEGWHSVGFVKDLSAGVATAAALRIASDPRVAAVELDRRILPAGLTKPVLAKDLAALKPASAVRLLSAKDAWSAIAPDQAAVKLSWSAPASISGATLVGYRIESNDGAGWKFLISSTSKNTSLTVKQGLKPGVKYSFRIAAITKLATATKVGSFSIPTSVTLTSTPQAPVFNGSNTAFGSTSPHWVSQNKTQTGGLPLLGYIATATATGQTPVTCSAPPSETTCVFNGLVPNITYTVSVAAKNARGATSSVPGVTPLDPLFNKQWALTAPFGVNVTNAWSRTMGSKNVIVAVIDSGITAHPDLDNQVIPGYDFVSDVASSGDGDGWDANNADPGDFFGNDPSSWHGTHVAGIIGAQSNNIGVAGVAPNVKIMPVRALGSDGGKSSDLIAALRWSAGIHVDGAPDNKTPAQVVNMSMGTDTATPCRLPGQATGATEDALADLKKAGVTVISAAGNFNMPATASYPGNCYPTINVGATRYSGDRASYSNYSILDSTGQMAGVDISAPGGDSKNPGDSPAESGGKILSTINTGKTTPLLPDYAYEEGTSMAAPIVTGVVALIYSVKPKITFDQVWEVLKATATKFPTGSECEVKGICGVGIVNAGAAVASAAALP